MAAVSLPLRGQPWLCNAGLYASTCSVGSAGRRGPESTGGSGQAAGGRDSLWPTRLYGAAALESHFDLRAAAASDHQRRCRDR